MTDTFRESVECPFCGRPNDAVTRVAGEGRPEPGRKSATGKQRPLDVRPCETCGEDIFFALRAPIGGSWRALNAAPVTDDRKAFALVLIGHQAWRRVDLLEHYLITKQVGEEKARELVDTYPHHLLHVHDREDS